MNKLVCFDFDGVIIDSTESKTLAFIDVYKHEASEKQLNEIVQYHKDNFGVNRVKKFEYYEQYIFNRNSDKNKIAELCEKFKLNVENRLKKITIFLGTEEFLKEIKTRGIPILIVSGAPQEEIEEILIREDIHHYFEEIYDGTESKINHLSSIIDKYNITNEHIVFLGDATTDYDAASHFNIPFVAVNACYPSKPHEKLRVSEINDLNSIKEKFFSIF